MDSRICLVLIEKNLEKNLENIKRFRNWIDIVELRADYLEPDQYEGLSSFPLKAGLPVILTFRKSCDGGKWQGFEKERIDLFKKALPGGYSFFDLEEDVTDDAFLSIIKSFQTRIIRSMHDFNGVPEDIAKRFARLSQRDYEIPKMAVMPKSTKDFVIIVNLALQNRGKEKIILGMGSFGFPTRILAPLLGSYLSYSSVPDQSAAPGHIDPETLASLYRFKNISSQTKIFGIIGDPVMHTASPQIHNNGFAAINYDAVYIPFHVDIVKDFLDVIDLFHINGFSVTVPHKEKIISFLNEKDENVINIGACNTVVASKNGLSGSNTDGIGFMTPLKAKFEDGLKGKKVSVIGAGGAARAVVWMLVNQGCDVLVLNRTIEKAKKLAQEYRCSFAPLDTDGIRRMSGYSDIIVQTTNAGMVPDTSLDPIPGYIFKGNEVVYEIIYKPEMTTLLKRAQKAGCFLIFGKEMLLYQAYEQFRKFTGLVYPIIQKVF